MALWTSSYLIALQGRNGLGLGWRGWAAGGRLVVALQTQPYLSLPALTWSQGGGRFSGETKAKPPRAWGSAIRQTRTRILAGLFARWAHRSPLLTFPMFPRLIRKNSHERRYFLRLFGRINVKVSALAHGLIHVNAPCCYSGAFKGSNSMKSL